MANEDKFTKNIIKQVEKIGIVTQGGTINIGNVVVEGAKAHQETSLAASTNPSPTSEGETFDVFLCHNSQDKPEVREIALKLKEQGLTPWLDEWELRPGLSWQELLEEQIKQIKSAAVFVGSSGLGPWQQREIRALLNEFVNRSCPVIPVLLKDAPQKPQLPIFLKAMTWVDFRRSESNPMGRLIWGITGIKSTEE